MGFRDARRASAPRPHVCGQLCQKTYVDKDKVDDAKPSSLVKSAELL